MKFLKKIKLNYNYKIFNDHITNKRFDSAYKHIESLSNKNQNDFFILMRNIHNQLSQVPSDYIKNKIIWIFSYDIQDTLYLVNFLNEYLRKNSKSSSIFSSYANSINTYLSDLNLKNQDFEIKFIDFQVNSYLYQSLISFSNKKDFLFLNSPASFFETNNQKYLIYPNNTYCYFYIFQKPEKLFLRYKKLYGSTEGAYDELFNFNQKEYLSSNGANYQYKVFENRTNINTNFLSWNDPNVISTYKGKVVDYDKFITDKENILLEILYHLKQFGMDLELNIEDVRNFISKNEADKQIDSDISQNEKKFLNKHLTINF